MKKVKNIILLIAQLFFALTVNASDDLIFNLSIQSSETGKVLHNTSNLKLNFSSPQNHLISKIKVNNYEIENFSYTCSEDICNYSVSSNLNSNLEEGPVTLSFLNSNQPDFAKYHLEIETDYNFTNTASENQPAPNPPSPPETDTPDPSEDENLKSPENASANELASIARFSTNTQNPSIAYEGETLIFAFVLRNKNDDLNFVKIADLISTSGPKTEIGKTKAYELRFDLSRLNPEMLRRIDYRIGFTLGINGKRFTNDDFNIDTIKYLSLDADKLFLNKEIKVTKTERANSYDVSFNVDRETAKDLDVKAMVLNNGNAYLVSKKNNGDTVSYSSLDLEILDYENEIKIVYEYLGNRYEHLHRFNLEENLAENDLSKLLKISSVELPFSGSFFRIGSSIALIKVLDSSEDMEASKTIIPTSKYDVIKIDAINKEILLAYKLNFELENSKLNLLTNKNQELSLEDLATNINSNIPSSRLLIGPSQINKKKISKMRKIIFDKESRLAIKGKKLKEDGKLYMLDRDAHFTQLTLGKTNRKAKKQFITSHNEIPSNGIYLIYFTNETGISFIKL